MKREGRARSTRNGPPEDYPISGVTFFGCGFASPARQIQFIWMKGVPGIATAEGTSGCSLPRS